MKTHVTVIPSDGIISVDGEVLFLDGIKSETFHALQWHDGAGHVEPGDGLPNEELSTDDYAGRVAPFVALWEEEKARLEEEANRPPTDEELAAQAVAEARAQSRTVLMARMQADMVQTGAFAAAEFATFAKAGLFTDWAAGQTYAKGYRLAHKGIVYEVMQEVTAIENQPPDAAGLLAVYRPLSVDPETGDEPDGSREHPFAFLYGMDVTKDSYYTYEGKLWLAKADMPACVWTPGTAGLWQWEEARKWQVLTSTATARICVRVAATSSLKATSVSLRQQDTAQLTRSQTATGLFATATACRRTAPHYSYRRKSVGLPTVGQLFNTQPFHKQQKIKEKNETK